MLYITNTNQQPIINQVFQKQLTCKTISDTNFVNRIIIKYFDSIFEALIVNLSKFYGILTSLEAILLYHYFVILVLIQSFLHLTHYIDVVMVK